MMGLLVDGVWQDQWYDTRSTDGRFVRAQSGYRNWVTPDGVPGPSGQGGFRAAAGRYHLYVSLACPWAHRTLIFRKLKKLDHAVSVSVVEPLMLADGWVFGPPGSATADTVNGKAKLADVYLAADAKFTGRVTVPVLWDKERRTIVNNESPVQCGVRRRHRRPHRLLSGAAARRHRCRQRHGLRQREQRRLSHRLRHHPGRL
jgi:putative glutathione S-transferase